jgi:circadian clock protein KaiC
MNDASTPYAFVDERAESGSAALDHILNGGFPRNRLYLIEGDPGTGKTTVALQFLLAGVRRGEVALYVTLSETAEELRASARTHGWNLDGIAIHEFLAEDSLAQDAQYTVFQPSEVELGNTVTGLFESVQRTGAQRVVVDSLAEMRLLARDPLRYRRQILLLKQFFAGRGCTVMLLDDRTFEASDRQLHSITHGVIRLEQLAREYGPTRRRLQVLKLRGTAYREGLHDFVIRAGGLQPFPRLVAVDLEEPFVAESLSSGIQSLDDMLGGGLEVGTTTLVTGPAGAGKSVLVTHYAVAAAARGHGAAFFLFDEERRTLLEMAASLAIPLADEMARGRVTVRAVNPAELSPGEFVHLVRDAVEREGARVIVLDSLNGYLAAMPEERMLGSHLRELFSYLRQRGVLSLITSTTHGIIAPLESGIDVSYLADAVLLLRFYEHDASLRRAISVVKRRGHGHEAAVNELRIGRDGIRVQPVVGLRGVLTGVPSLRGALENE